MILYVNYTSVKDTTTARPEAGKTKQKTTCVKNREQLGRGGGVGEEAGEVG